MTRSVTKATSIQFIDSRSHIKKQRGHKTVLSIYYASLSHDLLLLPLGADTHIHQHLQLKQFQETRRTDLWPTHFWLKTCSYSYQVIRVMSLNYSYVIVTTYMIYN